MASQISGMMERSPREAELRERLPDLVLGLAFMEHDITQLAEQPYWTRGMVDKFHGFLREMKKDISRFYDSQWELRHILEAIGANEAYNDEDEELNQQLPDLPTFYKVMKRSFEYPPNEPRTSSPDPAPPQTQAGAQAAAASMPGGTGMNVLRVNPGHMPPFAGMARPQAGSKAGSSRASAAIKKRKLRDNSLDYEVQGQSVPAKQAVKQPLKPAAARRQTPPRKSQIIYLGGTATSPPPMARVAKEENDWN